MSADDLAPPPELLTSAPATPAPVAKKSPAVPTRPGMPVESLQAAQFRHGPLELAGPDLAAIVLATEPETAELDRELAADLAKLGAAVLLVTTGQPAPGDTMSIAIGALDRLLSPAAAVVPAQLLAWRLSLTSGRTPGSYLHASKVTTRE